VAKTIFISKNGMGGFYYLYKNFQKNTEEQTTPG
jgi:hypothetical protein